MSKKNCSSLDVHLKSSNNRSFVGTSNRRIQTITKPVESKSDAKKSWSSQSSSSSSGPLKTTRNTTNISYSTIPAESRPRCNGCNHLSNHEISSSTKEPFSLNGNTFFYSCEQQQPGMQDEFRQKRLSTSHSNSEIDELSRKIYKCHIPRESKKRIPDLFEQQELTAGKLIEADRGRSHQRTTPTPLRSHSVSNNSHIQNNRSTKGSEPEQSKSKSKNEPRGKAFTRERSSSLSREPYASLNNKGLQKLSDGDRSVYRGKEAVTGTAAKRYSNTDISFRDAKLLKAGNSEEKKESVNERQSPTRHCPTQPLQLNISNSTVISNTYQKHSSWQASDETNQQFDNFNDPGEKSLHHDANIGTDNSYKRHPTSDEGFENDKVLKKTSQTDGANSQSNHVATDFTASSYSKMIPQSDGSFSGLRNLGNTCYMNSILQCLAQTIRWQHVDDDDFTVFLTNEDHHHGSLVRVFFALREQMSCVRDSGSLDPSQFKHQINLLSIRFAGYQQQDAHEFLLCLLKELNEELQRAQDDGLIKDNVIKATFMGELQNTVSFHKCQHRLEKTQPFYSVCLPIGLPGKQSWDDVLLRKCLDHFTREEIMDEENEALCFEQHKPAMRQPCSIQMSFKQLPDVLILHLNRGDLLSYRKLETKVEFPLQLTIGDCTGADVNYLLYGVCNHYGTLHFGHYTADVKNMEGKWFTYSDSSVRPTNRYYASTSSNSGNWPEPKSADAYLLFYEKRQH